jgi:hypothetical protein
MKAKTKTDTCTHCGEAFTYDTGVRTDYSIPLISRKPVGNCPTFCSYDCYREALHPITGFQMIAETWESDPDPSTPNL